MSFFIVYDVLGCCKDTTPNPIFNGLAKKYFIVIFNVLENYDV
jgi:hypothetical protein